MARRLRVRRVAEWAGLATCILLLALFPLSLWWEVSWYTAYSAVWLAPGAIEYQCTWNEYAWFLPMWRMEAGWHIVRRPSSEASLKWWAGFSWWADSPPPASKVSGSFGVLPIWLALLLAGAPTAYLWWRDRPPPPGHCRHCGYDLTGNTTGVCPECGVRLRRMAGRGSERWTGLCGRSHCRHGSATYKLR